MRALLPVLEDVSTDKNYLTLPKDSSASTICRFLTRFIVQLHMLQC